MTDGTRKLLDAVINGYKNLLVVIIIVISKIQSKHI